jgi:hypothetical protein
MPEDENTGSPENKAAAPSRAKAESLLAEIATLSNKTLPPLIRTMFDHADTTLFEMAEAAGETNPQESPYLKTMRELRNNRVEIETGFYSEIARSFDTALLPSGGKKEEGKEDETAFDFDIDSLSLVEDENLEGSLAVQKLVDRLRGHNQNLFNAIDKRLAHLLLHHNGNTHEFPATPETICGAFSKVLGTLEMERQIRQIIFKLFEIHVVNELGGFYEELNVLLTDGGILPNVQTNRPWRGQVAQRNASPRGADTQAAQTTQDNTTAADNMAASGGNGGGSHPQGGAATGGAAPQGGTAVAGATPQGGTIPQQGVAPSGASTQGSVQSADIDSGLLASLQSLLNFQGSTGVIPIQPGVTAAPGTTVSQVEPTQLLTGLTGLQHQQHAGGGAIDSASLKTMLAGVLQPEVGGTVGFQNRESMLIDMIAMLFEFILEDTTIPDSAKAQISRLQIPMVKAALIDESFLAKKANPARQLLNRLAQASAALERQGSENSPLLEAVIKVVDTITDQFENDMSIFEQQLNYLTDVLEEQNKVDEQVSERITDAKAKKEDELRKYRRVEDAVRLRLSTVDAPAPIRNLLESTWWKVLVYTGIKHGTDSELWQQRNDFIDKLIESLKPREGKEELRNLMQLIPLVVGTLRKGMLEAGFSEEAIQQVLKVIEPMHMAIITHKDTGDAIAEKARKHHAMEVALDSMESEMSHLDDMLESLDGSLLDSDYVREEAPIPAELLEDVTLSHEEPVSPDDLPDDEYIEAVRNIKIGQIVILHDKHDQPVRGKLSWKSDLLGEYVFTNWRHKVVAERTLNGLAVDLYRGKLELPQATSILERALGKVMSGMKQQQPDNAPA